MARDSLIRYFRRTLLCATTVATMALAIGSARAGERIEIVIQNGARGRTNTPVEAIVMVPRKSAHFPSELQKGNGTAVMPEFRAAWLDGKPIQLSRVRLGSARASSPDAEPFLLTLVVPRLEANQALQGAIDLGKDAGDPADPLIWRSIDEAGKPIEGADAIAPGARLAMRLARDGAAGQPLLCFEYPILDESTPAAREATYKPFHHAYAPGSDRIITKGPGGKYTHHRGLFYGFNKISYGDGKNADVWHCKGDAHQSISSFEDASGGSLMGRQRVGIRWHGMAKEVFANEEREMTAYEMPGGTLIEFVSLLETTGGAVKLDGDPQHAGFHFRADNEVAEKTSGETYFLRPDGKGELGKTRNWPADKGHINLPWNAMSFVVGGKRYTALYLDHPSNPKEARYSEREYGRFGSYFEYELTKEKPLLVRYRVWLQEGEMTKEQCEALSADFVDPPKATAKWVKE